MRLVNSIDEANCITHSGTMHADEVFATAFLDLYLDDVRVFRTGRIDNYTGDALVYDIGRGKFDHHQLDAEKRDNGITYSSLGLLWREYGRDFLNKYNFENIEEMFIGIDKDLIEGIDADDNGVFPKIESNCKVKTLPSIIKIFNPSFDSGENESEQFLKAVKLAKMIFEEEIVYINGKIISDKKVTDIINNSDISKGYLYLDEYFPYEDAIINHPDGDKILFVAFPSNRGGYAIKTVAKSSEDKTARRLFPEEWGGLQDSQLEEVSGILGLRFCHTGRFIVNCSSLDAMNKVLDIVCK
ncbi:MAG: MYG1 family protein [Bacilli bacterium]|nr:MYG1 family protein [Bacilli bacterium]